MRLIRTSTAAEKLGVTATWVRALIADGRLPAIKAGRDYFINEANLARVQYRKPGRPPGRKNSPKPPPPAPKPKRTASKAKKTPKRK